MKKFYKNYIEPVLIAIVISFILANFVLLSVKVEGSSMYPNLKDGQGGISFVISKYFGVDRFEIVVVKSEDKEIVKRVIGLPNEKIDYVDDELYVNSQLINQDFDFIKDGTEDFSVELKEDEYFVLGDNRVVSRDSRDIGPIKKSQITSLHVLVLTPFQELGFRR